MKQISILITLALLSSSLLGLSAQSHPQVETTFISLSRRDYSVSYQRNLHALTIDLDLTPYSKVKSQELLCIYPVYRSKDVKHEQKLAPIYIVGTARHKQILRNKLLRNLNGIIAEIASRPSTATYAISGDIVTPHYELPYETWMRRGELRLYMQRYGCATCPTTLVAYLSDDIELDSYNFSRYNYTFIRPADEETKEYKKSFNSYVRFSYDSDELILTQDNTVELDRLYSFISSSLEEEGVHLSKLSIEGYCSPEGSASYNQRLSEYRAQALYKYIQLTFPDLTANIEVSGIGEDWSGLRRLITESNLSNKEQILSIINYTKGDQQREQAMRKLDNYDQILVEFYPLLRRTSFTMSYHVGSFSKSELASVYAKNPLLLKQCELYYLAEQAVARDDSPVGIFRSAYEQYPKDPIAILNYANALLKYDHDAEQAYQLLFPIRTDARAKLPLSIATNMISSSNP